MPAELQISDIVTFVAPLAASAVSLAAAHWFPWHDRARALSRLAAYGIGTAVTVGIPAATMVLTHALGLAYGPLFWAALLLCNAAVSGVTVAAAYYVDSRQPVSLEDMRNAAAQQ